MVIAGDGGVGKKELANKYFSRIGSYNCPICKQEFQIPNIYSHINTCNVSTHLFKRRSKTKSRQRKCPFCYRKFKVPGIYSHIRACAKRKIHEDIIKEDSINTIGIQFFIKDMALEGLGRVRLQVWIFVPKDKRHRFLLPTYVKGANGIMFLYSTTNMLTLSHFDDWLPILRNYDPTIPIMLVGTKVHLKNLRRVQKHEAIDVARSRGCSSYVEMSIEKSINVEEAFRTLTKVMWNYQSRRE